jgi:hypothetical protein
VGIVKGQHSIRIKSQFRVRFVRRGAGANSVEIVECHEEVAVMVLVPTRHAPTHPGEMLRQEFLDPMGLTQRELANGIRVPY